MLKSIEVFGQLMIPWWTGKALLDSSLEYCHSQMLSVYAKIEWSGLYGIKKHELEELTQLNL